MTDHIPNKSDWWLDLFSWNSPAEWIPGESGIWECMFSCFKSFAGRIALYFCIVADSIRLEVLYFNLFIYSIFPLCILMFTILSISSLCSWYIRFYYFFLYGMQIHYIIVLVIHIHTLKQVVMTDETADFYQFEFWSCAIIK